MKVITIKQPFASLIASGQKEYEFRTWKTSYRGDILIHAGKSVDKEAMNRFSSFNLDYPLGCIIAKANLTNCIPINEDVKEELRAKNAPVYWGITSDPTWSGYGFKLENIQKIDPIYVNGSLGLWEFDYTEE